MGYGNHSTKEFVDENVSITTISDGKIVLGHVRVTHCSNVCSHNNQNEELIISGPELSMNLFCNFKYYLTIENLIVTTF